MNNVIGYVIHPTGLQAVLEAEGKWKLEKVGGMLPSPTQTWKQIHLLDLPPQAKLELGVNGFYPENLMRIAKSSNISVRYLSSGLRPLRVPCPF